VFRVEALVWW